ncbi:Ubiquitin fusion degradation protein 4 [Haplosporangium gracile]|nr:Ubiquitin fusion degradation protein 4 [Haplosporangium gracile]
MQPYIRDYKAETGEEFTQTGAQGYDQQETKAEPKGTSAFSYMVKYKSDYPSLGLDYARFDCLASHHELKDSHLDHVYRNSPSSSTYRRYHNENNNDDDGGDEDDDEDDENNDADDEGDKGDDADDHSNCQLQSDDQDDQGILANLRAYEGPSLRLIALQDLGVLLSVPKEESLDEYFCCESFVNELMLMWRGIGRDIDNPEIMLLAYRCLSKLMEAMPASLGTAVDSEAISTLCSRLIEIQCISLAEQALPSLEIISSEFPRAVVKEGGLAAVFMYFEFFSTNAQRTAVKTAANCC